VSQFQLRRASKLLESESGLAAPIGGTEGYSCCRSFRGLNNKTFHNDSYQSKLVCLLPKVTVLADKARSLTIEWSPVRSFSQVCSSLAFKY